MTIDLGEGVEFHADRATGCALTRYADGFECGATRPRSEDNLRELIDQGYLLPDNEQPITDNSADAALWRSLLEHELLHTLIARAIFCRESLVLRHESGAEHQRYALRLHEEALAISYQRWLHTEEPDLVLWPYSGLLQPLRARLETLLVGFG